MTAMEPPYRVLEASHLAASPLLESVNWLLDAVHHQHSAFSNVLEQLQELQAFKEVTDATLKSIKEDMTGVASQAPAEGLASEIAACYTKDVVERAQEASKSSVKPGQERPEEDISAEIPKVVHEELNRMESELKEQIRELQEALRTAPPAAESVEVGEVKTQEDARLMALEVQISELKDKLDSVLPSSTTELAPSAPADVTPTVPDTDASLQAGSNEALLETTEVNGPVVVVNPPALVVNPPAAVVNPPAATAAGPAGAAAVHAAAPPETVELVGRVKVLEGKVHSLTEALEVLRESLDFPEDLAPAVAEGTGAEATPETANPTQPGDGPDGTAAVQMPAPGSKSEVPSSGRGSRPGSRENWKTLASSLESLDLRVTALEQWRAAADPHDATGGPAVTVSEAPAEDAPVEPQQTAPEERRPSANEPKVPPLRLPGLPKPVGPGPAMRLAQCVEGSDDLEERLSLLQEVHPLPAEQSNMLNSIVQDVRLCLKRCELILQLPEIKTFIRKFQSSLQVNAVLHDRWLGPRQDEEPSAPKIEQCKSMGDLTSVAADPCRPKRGAGEVPKRPFRTVTDWARPHTPLTLDPQSGPKLPEI